MNKLLLAFTIYTISFCNLGNTCYRINSDNIKVFNIIPLFTEGIWGPIRSTYLLFIHDGLYNSVSYIISNLLSLHNIFGAYLFVMYITNLNL